MSAGQFEIVGRVLGPLMQPTVSMVKPLYLVAHKKGNVINVEIVTKEALEKAMQALQSSGKPFVVYGLKPIAIGVRRKYQIAVVPLSNLPVTFGKLKLI